MNNVADSSFLDIDFLSHVMKQPLLTKEEELEFAKAWKNDESVQSLNKLVTSHMRLVVSIALKFRYYGLPLSDLVQEGILGLMKAAQRFDLDHEVRFSSYAKWWIKASIQDYVLKNWSIVRMGATTAHKMLFFHLNRMRRDLGYLAFESMKENDLKDVAEKLKVHSKEVEFIEKRLSLSDFSLNADVNDDAESVWMDLLQDHGPSPEDASIDNDDDERLHHWIELALSQLSDRERYIIIHRRLKEPFETLDAIGAYLGLTKERVRQLELKAIRKMGFVLKKNLTELRNFL